VHTPPPTPEEPKTDNPPAEGGEGGGTDKPSES
jgi:hypothetical protein